MCCTGLALRQAQHTLLGNICGRQLATRARTLVDSMGATHPQRSAWLQGQRVEAFRAATTLLDERWGPRAPAKI